MRKVPHERVMTALMPHMGETSRGSVEQARILRGLDERLDLSAGGAYIPFDRDVCGASNRIHTARHAGMVAAPGWGQQVARNPHFRFRGCASKCRRTTIRVLRYRLAIHGSRILQFPHSSFY